MQGLFFFCGLILTASRFLQKTTKNVCKGAGSTSAR